MAFDKNLDECLFSDTREYEVTRLTVGVFSYNSGGKKMQISRENRNTTTGEWTFAKLGRLTKEEVDAIIPMMQKAMQVMKKEREEKKQTED